MAIIVAWITKLQGFTTLTTEAQIAAMPLDSTAEAGRTPVPANASGKARHIGIAPNAIETRLTRRGPWLHLFTSKGFEWNKADIPIEDLPPALEGFRILHITDLHLRSYWTRAYEDLIEQTHRENPDLILITGDFVDSKRDHRAALPHLKKLLTGLRSRLGTLGIIGNHDGDLLGPKIAAWNVRLIGSKHVELHISGDRGSATLELIGMAGADRGDVDLDFLRALGPKPRDTARVVLSHYPDGLCQIRHLGADIFLAGHTHGGQVCLPNGWALIRHDSLPRCVLKGIHRVNGTWLVANRGFGFASLPIRMFCPAEVIEMTLRRATPQHT